MYQWLCSVTLDDSFAGACLWFRSGAHDERFGFAGNVVTPTFLLIVLVASMVGIASTLAGAHHLRVWRTESLAGAAAAAAIAWLLTLLAMGLACKQIHTRYGRNKRLVQHFLML